MYPLCGPGRRPLEQAMTTKCACATCGGTGKIFAAKSMFLADGFRRLNCGICDGSGVSAYRGEPSYTAWQSDRRAEQLSASQ